MLGSIFLQVQKTELEFGEVNFDSVIAGFCLFTIQLDGDIINLMPKLIMFLMVFLFVATPLLALLSLHDYCSEQICHILMTGLFILTSAVTISATFLITPLINKVSLFKTLCYKEVFLPPRP